MSNEFYEPSGVPSNNAPGTSALIRDEFATIAEAFNKLPAMAGNAGELVVVNATGNGLEASGIGPASFVTWSSPGTLTNKIINWADNTIGTIPVEGGGTGATDLLGAQMALGINLKANALNAVLSGTPTAETAPSGTATTRLATTEFVANAVVASGGTVPSVAAPLMNGASALAGSASPYSREDHVHPRDTSRMPAAGGTFTGTVNGITEPTADNSTKFATTAWVRNFAPTFTIPTSQVTGLDAALVAKAPLSSPTFTGIPLLTTTPTAGDSTKKIASTEFVSAAITAAGVGSLGLTVSQVGTANGVAAVGISGDAARADHVHPYDVTKQDVAKGHMFAPVAPIIVPLITHRTLALSEAGGRVVSLGYGTLTLPPLATCTAGVTTYTLQSLYGCTIKGNAAESIILQPDGYVAPVTANSHTIAGGRILTLVADVGEWRVFSESRALVASTAEAKAGSANNVLMSPLAMANSTLGRNQTVTDVTASRVISTAPTYVEYTNGTGNPLYMTATFDCGDGVGVDLYVDGIHSGTVYQTGAAVRASLNAVIKAGGKYCFVKGPGTPTIASVMELKTV